MFLFSVSLRDRSFSMGAEIGIRACLDIFVHFTSKRPVTALSQFSLWLLRKPLESRTLFNPRLSSTLRMLRYLGWPYQTTFNINYQVIGWLHATTRHLQLFVDTIIHFHTIR